MYKLNKDIIINKLGNAYVAYDNSNQQLHELNEIGYFILEEIEKKKSAKQIIDNIIEKYYVDRKKASDDLGKYIEILIGKKLVSK
mgnify:CR=1 FL=1